MQTIEEILKECGAVLDGHFLLTSGRHSKQYFEKAEICADPVVTADFCWEMSQDIVSRLEASGENEIEVVVGLAPIGVVLSNRVAEYLQEIYQEKIISVFTEKDEQGRMIFKRGYAKKITGKKVLIVDDVLTTGGSVGQVKNEVEKLGGKVAAIAIICQRGKVRSEDLKGTPILSLFELQMEDWAPEECPLCKAKIPLRDPKSR